MARSNSFTTSKSERLSYGLYAFGAILSYYLIMSYLQLYMTDIGISAIAVGFIFMLAKVWDAVNDPIFGILVDKLNPKGGKYKTWLKIATIAIPLSTILLFIIPSELSIQVKIIWSTLAYVVWDTSYTMYDVPFNAIVTSMTEDIHERNKLYSIGGFCVYLGALIVAITVPMLFPNIGWGATGALVALLCFVSMIPLNIKCKERFTGSAEKEISVKDIIMSLLHNKYLLIFTLCNCIGGVTNFAMVLNGYFAIHCLGGEQWITPLALTTAVPVLAVVLFIPSLLKKVDKFIAAMATRIISIGIDLLIFSLGYKNIALLLTLIVIKNIFSAVWSVSTIMFLADCVEYGQFKNGDRAQGIAFSTKAFTNKLIVALTGAFAMFGLAAYGFIAGTGVTQSQQTIDGIWFLYSFFPIIGSLIAVAIFLIFYKLRDKDVQLMIKVNNGEITREEAEKLFVKKF